MKKITKQTQSNSISFLGLLFILFLGLKLAGIGQVAKWSWWWVTAPLWGGPVLVIGIVITALVLGFFGGLIFRLIKSIIFILKLEQILLLFLFEMLVGVLVGLAICLVLAGST